MTTTTPALPRRALAVVALLACALVGVLIMIGGERASARSTVARAAAPAVAVNLSYTSSFARIVVSVAPSSRPTVLVVRGDRRATVRVAPGRRAEWSAAAQGGAHLELSFRSGVQRRDGSWRYGARASLVTP